MNFVGAAFCWPALAASGPRATRAAAQNFNTELNLLCRFTLPSSCDYGK
jgi:hypothetical protein